MNTPHRLPIEAEELIKTYLELPLGLPPYGNTPYYNNRRAKIRGGLRARIGKGTPKDIIEEAKTEAFKEKIPLQSATNSEVRDFLNKHYLGVDCSGFVYHILNAVRASVKKPPLQKIIIFPKTYNLLRFFLRRMRHVENTNVAVFAENTNSHTIPVDRAEPGDFIVLCGQKQHTSQDHIMIITEVLTKESGEILLLYAHSLSWDTDMQHSHGVRIGSIELENASIPLLKGIWTEQNKTGTENGTLQNATNSLRVEIRRLNR